MKMKRILLGLSVVLGMISCDNQDIDFPDYTSQTVCFPIQYPVRTLVLGESSSDNSIDLEHAFSIGACVGGLSENTKDRVVKIRLAPELVANATITSSGLPLQILPSDYYTISSSSEIVIPKGEFSGKIRVDLNDAFFSDTLAVKMNYVIPLVITEETADSVLVGTPNPSVANPDRRLLADWLAGFEPKDYTLFMIKYINKYHGTYLHRGVDWTLDGQNGNVVDTASYHAKYIEQDLLTSFTTNSLTSCTVNRLGLSTGASFQMKLEVDGDNNIVIGSVPGAYKVSGTGKLVMPNETGADVWGGEKRMTAHLDYTYLTADTVYHHCTDTLVFRDNNMKLEEFKITVVK